MRTPFAVSGTVYKDMMAVDLQKEALKGAVFLRRIDYELLLSYRLRVSIYCLNILNSALVRRTGVDYKHIDHVICGTVIQAGSTQIEFIIMFYPAENGTI